MTSLPVNNQSELFFEIATMQEWSVQQLYTADQKRIAGRYSILWVQQGEGTYDNGVAVISLQPDHVYFLHGAQQQIICCDAVHGFMITFGEQFLTSGELEFDLTCRSLLINQFSKTSGMAVEEALASEFRMIVSGMMKEYANSFVFKTEVIKRYLKIMLIHLMRTWEKSNHPVAQSKKMELVERFMDKLEKDFRTKKLVHEYARSLLISSNYLNQTVRVITGHSARFHIRQKIVTEAKRMALRSHCNMKEISYHLGFQDSAHFSKFFKAVTGNNFSEYKKQKLTLM